MSEEQSRIAEFRIAPQIESCESRDGWINGRHPEALRKRDQLRRLMGVEEQHLAPQRSEESEPAPHQFPRAA